MNEIKCASCGKANLRAVRREHTHTVGSQQFSAEIEVLECPNCGNRELTAEQMKTLERMAALHIAQHGPVSGKTFRYMRRTAGIPAKEVAEAVGVAPETVSRWENGERDVDRSAWIGLALLVRDELLGATAFRSFLASLQEKPAKVVHLAPLPKRAKVG